jgi:DNA-directed RNA polymerase specialized sigma24 family protein
MSQFNTEYIPTSNEDLFLVYFQPENGLIRQTIRSKSQGKFDDDTVSEISATIMFRFIESDLLSRFDPKRISSFASFLYNITVNAVMDHYRYLKRNGSDVEIVESTTVSDESEETRDAKHVAAVEASQQVTVEWNETIECMQRFVSRCARLNRHKRDRSVRSILAMSSDGDTLEAMSASIGTSVATVRNYVRYIAHGALAETNGTAAQYASESSYRPDARREMSSKDLASLVRSHPDKPLCFADSDGSVSFPMFVSYRRGWHFVTMGETANVDLSALTGSTRGFKLFKSNETVIKVRHFDETADSILVAESAPSK